ncbi:histidine phosphatase family protein [Candidatus Thorarchaeota archaeon]|nr:MAG: histidine phosphatase family protein [Candidatus Thorarchaeota archaeon]
MYVQERETETRTRIQPRTLAYIITVGETERDNCEKLTERGKNQIIELARSRVVAGVGRMYSSSLNPAHKTNQMLCKEFGSEASKKDCLSTVRIPGMDKRYEGVKDTLVKMWEDETFCEKKGESLFDARQRVGDCMSEIAAKHANDAFAVVCDPLIGALFDSLVSGAPIAPELWTKMGHAACGTDEYSRGWSVVMPPDNSYLSDPTYVRDTLPDGFF